MSNVKLFIASSVDGYIARSNGDVDWLFTDGDYGYTAFYESVDAVVMGRMTYEQILSFGDYPHPTKQSFVLSRSKAGTSDANVQFVAPDLPEWVDQLRRSLTGDIWLVGGAKVVHAFLRQKLVDDIILSIQPTLLGSGIPLFLASDLESTLQLVDSKSFASGLVQLHYTTKSL